MLHKLILVLSFILFFIVPYSSFSDEVQYSKLKTSCHKKNISHLEGFKKLDQNLKEDYARELFLYGDYKKSLNVIIGLIDSKLDSSGTLGLAAAVAISAGRPELSKLYLSKIIENNSKDNWVYLDLYKLGSVSMDMLLNKLCSVTNDKVILVECAKVLKEEGLKYKKFLHKSLEISIADKEDKYSYITAFKALDLLGEKKRSLLFLSKISQTNPSYIASLREKVRLYSDLRMHDSASDTLEELLSYDIANPINNLVAFDYYVKIKQPFEAMDKYLIARKCLGNKSNDIMARKGYVLEVLGQPMSRESTFYSSASSFMSYFRPSELMQNSYHELGYNLYYFRNNILKIGGKYKLNNDSFVTGEIGLNKKTGKQNETDYFLTLGVVKNSFVSDKLLENKLLLKYIPVQDNSNNEILRHSYSIENQSSLSLDEYNASLHLKFAFGSEKIVSTNGVSDYRDISIMANKNYLNKKLEVPFGLGFKDISTAEVDFVQGKLFLGLNYQISSSLYLSTYNELFTVAGSNLYSIYQTVKFKYSILKHTSLNFEVSNESDLTNQSYRQLIYGLSLANDYHIRGSKIKSFIEFKNIKNYGVFDNNEMFLNFKVGMPF